ncbi:hypothetical protein [Fodinicola feengrottensis]|uniref:hypothetical protein n=1 Tax=Fodinicola feengrottensis TaxID=435914 RepID=UPI0036F2CC25
MFELTFVAGLDKTRSPALAEAGQALFTNCPRRLGRYAATTVRRAGWYSLSQPRRSRRRRPVRR